MPTKTKSSVGESVCRLANRFRKDVDKLDFAGVVPWVYNPLAYASKPHLAYLRRYARASCKFMFLGMNPGPWGMAQTGVPFGEIPAVREFLQIDEAVSKPKPEHPKRPIEGLNCQRSEVSGRRLWGLFAEQFPNADSFFEEHFVCNYCPLVFMEESARNVTPDKLPSESRSMLEKICDKHLADLIRLLEPEWIVGVGAFAEKCATRVQRDFELPQLQIGRILHPSPASPAANKDWAGTATRQLKELGIWS